MFGCQSRAKTAHSDALDPSIDALSAESISTNGEVVDPMRARDRHAFISVPASWYGAEQASGMRAGTLGRHSLHQKALPRHLHVNRRYAAGRPAIATARAPRVEIDADRC